ncbi:protein LTO1 homolog isoform X2 [Chiloscyllium punctatum]|uniref:protein LTO1 homolog isoform X2 n=1 Tax=Chiloscyllium punctatum TaxID=137246 RepID=UPI003B632585
MADPGGDLFDSIVLAEDRFRGEGYQEGFTEGGHLGETEGRRYGLVNGAKIGSEVSFYEGFAYTWKCLLQNNQDVKSSKRLKALNSLLAMVHDFPYENPTYDKLQEDLEKMRAKFKQSELEHGCCIRGTSRYWNQSISAAFARAWIYQLDGQAHQHQFPCTSSEARVIYHWLCPVG